MRDEGGEVSRQKKPEATCERKQAFCIKEGANVCRKVERLCIKSGECTEN